jgi:hypothetical protein
LRLRNAPPLVGFFGWLVGLQPHQFPDNEERNSYQNLGFSPFDYLTWLVARVRFFVLNCRESFRL